MIVSIAGFDRCDQRFWRWFRLDPTDYPEGTVCRAALSGLPSDVMENLKAYRVMDRDRGERGTVVVFPVRLKDATDS